MRDHDEQVERAALALRARFDDPRPEVLITLGSGLSAIAEAIEDPVDVPVAAIPGTPVGRVPGHPALLRYGRLGRRQVLAQVGRAHLYEGYTADEVVRVVDVAAKLGATSFVVTNAAGGLRPETQEPGDLLVIADHLNLTGTSPLAGGTRAGSPLFVDMAAAYDAPLRRLAVQVAAERGIRVHEGIYAGLPGPAYETPAEVAMLQGFGADAVGMSTVLEVLAARASGLRVLGISTITNVHGRGTATDHAEVLDVGAGAAERVVPLVLEVLARW